MVGWTTLHHPFADLSDFPHCIVDGSLVSTFFPFCQCLCILGHFLARHMLLIYSPRIGIVEYDVISTCSTPWRGGKQVKMKLCVFPGDHQYWAYFLCARPMCARWQVVCGGSGYRVSPAGVGQELGRKCSPGDWPKAQTASVSDPVLPFYSSKVNPNLPALTTLPGMGQVRGKE